MRRLPGGPASDPPEPGNPEESSRLRRQLRLVSPSVQVSLSPAAAREYDGLPRAIRERVLGIFERLARWPEVSGAKPMSGELAGLHRMRTGDYRVLFHVEGERVLVVRIGHRSGFYED